MMVVNDYDDAGAEGLAVSRVETGSRFLNLMKGI
jgi:hypothetical protein